MEKNPRVAIVGAGFISDIHIQALRTLKIPITAVCDIKKSRAISLAARHQIPKVFDQPQDLIQEHCADYVHILVPPNRHTETTIPFLEAGYSVLLEKPMAETPEDCERMDALAKQKGVKLLLNHNNVFQPAQLKFKAEFEKGKLGKIHHVVAYWNVPLRQISTQQFGHWMFQQPLNILLEQCVHPLSQLWDLLGGIRSCQAINLHRQELVPGTWFFDTWTIAVVGQNANAELYFSVGQNYQSFGMLVICDNGQAYIDHVNNICAVQTKTKWPSFYDSYTQGNQLWKSIRQQNRSNLIDYALATLHWKPRSDTFFQTMLGSIRAYYFGKETETAVMQPQVGKRLVELCHDMIHQVRVPEAKQPTPHLYSSTSTERFDALLIGGTGFIGRKLVEKLVHAGKRVLVAARNIQKLDSIFYHDLVTLVAADIADAAKIKEIVGRANVVIHLAHGGSASTWQDVEENMIAGTRNIAEACLLHQTSKLIYIGTIASLYLGNSREIITGKTPMDPKLDERSMYSKGKGKCDEMLLEMQQKQGLRLCILRPGVVIGHGGQPCHSGLGLFNQDTYCIGWNAGNNPLPFVLVEDVAEAIYLAFEKENALGKVYNVVGDVRLTAREYIQELSETLGYQVHYLPQPLFKTQTIEIFKWLVKILFQHRKISMPSYRDLKSRGMVAQFDCTDLKQDLGWQPEQNQERFITKGIRVYRP